MRRSKSNPAKYARNYRSISQRRMTNHEDNDDDEMKRLKQIVQSSQHLLNSNNDKEEPNDNNDNNNNKEKEDAALSYYGNDDIVVLPSKKKKQKQKQKKVIVTPEELRAAKAAHKNAQRKLQQLEQRQAQKRKRQELYDKLENSAISNATQQLLFKSSEKGKKRSKKERLQRLLQKERAGVVLTKEEEGFLYTDRPDVNDDDLALASTATNTVSSNSTTTTATNDSGREEEGPPPSKKAKKKKKRKKKKPSVANDDGEDEAESSSMNMVEEDKDSKMEDNKLSVHDDEATPSTNTNGDKEQQETDGDNDDDNVDDDNDDRKDTDNDDKACNKPTTNFAAQMMASLTKLKTKTDATAPKKTSETLSSLERIATKDDATNKYIPINPVKVQTAAQLGLTISSSSATTTRTTVQIQRPPDVKESRQHLPISSMEFEITDAIQSHDVTILCSETGSGKSTQVPQFLYELDPSSNQMIAITQPRRVAAVSTAKRVAYEMGCSSPSSGKKNKLRNNNLVAYQTRYESAGLGQRTKLKFMTDGILLQEIQSDLLLRKYSVIVLDEAHERNLNTDVLLGLLSKTISLRKQAALEEAEAQRKKRKNNNDTTTTTSIQPLKLVIMSATLRVDDFTSLYPNPAVVRVPGRTFPVTVHHSKHTELDDYEGVAYQKVVQIHRKLPKGGILVFVTGQAEIRRLVTKLRKRFSKNNNRKENDAMTESSTTHIQDQNNNSHLRDMDDDEMDGDIMFQEDDDYDDDEDSVSDSDDEGDDDNDKKKSSPENYFDPSANIPKKCIILPLYSMLSVEEQQKIFEQNDDSENIRLIVISTNVAETSLTIPGISYVVDTGRHKCRNFAKEGGVSSYDIMWISKAAADQRAGRAGRTGPGHCYRLYSSALYSRQFSDFAIPEVLCRPLEDVVLAMKAMAIAKVKDFPFPTPPDISQVQTALELLSNLGCLDASEEITRMGKSIAQLPLGVRYGKMLLVAAQAGVLDYAIAMVAILSENSPFVLNGGGGHEEGESSGSSSSSDDDDDNNEIDKKELLQKRKERRKEMLLQWKHRKGGDVVAGLLAVGAYSYAGQGAGGMAEQVACERFCQQNGLHPTIMGRVQKLRRHLTHLVASRLNNDDSTKRNNSKMNNMLSSSLKPPNPLQQQLLQQAIASGLLDHVAMLAPPGTFVNPVNNTPIRSAYMSCTSDKEPLFVDPTSAVYTRDFRSLPSWVVYDSVVRKTRKNGVGIQLDKDGNAIPTTIAVMKRITPIDVKWLSQLSIGSRLLELGEPLATPPPLYDVDQDLMLCAARTKFASWEIPSPRYMEMYTLLQKYPKNKAQLLLDDSFRYFARYLLEGKVLPEILQFSSKKWFTDDPALIVRKTPSTKVASLVSALSAQGIDSREALIRHWATVDATFLYALVGKSWIQAKYKKSFSSVWKEMTKRHIQEWRGEKQEQK